MSSYEPLYASFPENITERKEGVHLEWPFGNEMLVKVLCGTVNIFESYSLYFLFIC